MARPTKYKPDDTPRIAGALAKRGASDEEIAEALGIVTSTLYDWKNQHPTFSEAIKDGRDFFDSGLVENALLQRALGYTAPDCKVFMVDRLNPDTGQVEKVEHIVELEKHYPPEVAALIFWLKNRQPGRWRDKIDHTHSGDPDNPIRAITTTMTAQEAAEAYADTLHNE